MSALKRRHEVELRMNRFAISVRDGSKGVLFDRAVDVALEVADLEATGARNEAFAEVALHMKALVEAAATDDPIDRRRKVAALLARMESQKPQEGAPLQARLAGSAAAGLRKAVEIFRRHAEERGHYASQTIKLAAAECERLAVEELYRAG